MLKVAVLANFIGRMVGVADPQRNDKKEKTKTGVQGIKGCIQKYLIVVTTSWI